MPYAAAKHARYLEPGVVYHVTSRTRGNLFLLRPDLAGAMRQIVVGILAEAKSNFPNVNNFATAILSNHLHALLAAMSGDPRLLASYVGFVKRELTRRWKQEVGWSGSIFEPYVATAIISPEAQLRALRYVCAQGVKEGLVERPQQWPGFHCADSLVTGEPMQGFWHDGTAYGKAFHAEKLKKSPDVITRATYNQPRTFAFDPLPCLAQLPPEEYRTEMRAMVDTIVVDGEVKREGRPALGPAAICAQHPMTSRPVPPPPWYEDRRHLVAWDNPRDPRVLEYGERYWAHQVRCRQAAKAWRESREVDDLAVDTLGFPPTSFVGGKWPRPLAHIIQGERVSAG